MDAYVGQINQIYQTYNIYKSIIIVDSYNLHLLYNLMKKQDYPVTTTYHIKSFVDNQSRILIININEANNFHDIVQYLNKDEINTVICIDNKIWLKHFENVNHIFL